VVLAAKNVNADETGWYLRSRRCWIWTGASPTATFFQIHSSRSREAFQRTFGTFNQILTSDRYGAYNQYTGEKQVCLAHLLRDFTKMSERVGAEGAIGRILLGELKEIFGHWKKFKHQEISRFQLQEKVRVHIENLQDALTVGAGAAQISSKGQALCYDLLDRFSTLWTFVQQEGVEPTNNLAERGLRPLVIVRKLSHGSQSEWGAQFTERLMSVVCTLRQQARNVFSYLTQLFLAYFGKDKAPLGFA